MVETDLKKEISNYGLQHTGALACCLHLMAGAGFKGGAYAADFTVIGDVLRAPWGNSMGIASTLTTDHFPISYLGSEVGRTNKIRWLAEHKPNLFRYISLCHKDKSKAHGYPGSAIEDRNRAISFRRCFKLSRLF